MKYYILVVSLTLSCFACSSDSGISSLKLTQYSKAKLWKEARLPYVIIEEGFSEKKLESIAWAVKEVSDKTLVQVVERSADSPEQDYVEFVADEDSCNSKVGRRGGAQRIEITKSCSRGSIAHEILHALGFKHEQLHPNSGIVADTKKVRDGFEHNFNRSKALAVTEYDPNSIMHYDSWSFTICGKEEDVKWQEEDPENLPAKECMEDDWRKIGDCLKQCAVFFGADGSFVERQREALTDLDVLGIDQLYQPTREQIN